MNKEQRLVTEMLMYWVFEITFSYKEGSFLGEALPQGIKNAQASYDLNINRDGTELQNMML